jgi:hypothetical protein
VAPHSSGFWTSYEIIQGNWRGFGGGVTWNSDRSRDTENSFTLPSYFQTDIAIFSSQDNFRA